MSIQITLTDEHLRVSTEFMDFISNFREQKTNNADWFNQISEDLKTKDLQAQDEIIKRLAEQSITDPFIKNALNTSYNLTTALLTGYTDVLKMLHQRYKFMVVVGIPRSGGSYLTKQFFIAAGMNPARVPKLLAHDGFPRAYPFSMGDGQNENTRMIRCAAEFLTMVDLFYSSEPMHHGQIIVPKKDMNTAYYGAFFAEVLGAHSSYFVTIRHPVSCCISSYEKSGGYPESGRFVIRSHIENIISRDVNFTNKNLIVEDEDYFDVYLRYWEQYYTNLAITGLTGKVDITVVPFTADSLMGTAKNYYLKYKIDKPVEEFQVFNYKDRHPEWMERAERAIYRVEAVWKRSGLVLPVKELLEMR